MWWLFSNKKRDEGVFHNIHLLNKLKTIEDNIKNSFFNIKKDIAKVNSYLYHHDNSLEHLKERVLFLESHIKDLRSQNSEKIIKEIL